ncbi:MAG TPA: hypothetical protein VK714_16650 [Myxococcota bacterium]|nr:hypothetical protein [Myxococcota bacterium]
MWPLFAALALAVYWPSLRGEFLSDDYGYIVTNPYVHKLTLENLRVLLDPFGPATAYTANYAPIHLLVHAVEWSLFGEDTYGWRLLNVVLHAGVAVLLVPVFCRAGVAGAAAVFGALFFLLHPANAEVVAWIAQLKTILCLGFGTAALLMHPRRPALAALFFVLGVLSKATAAFALPVALFLSWRGLRTPAGPPPRWAWLGVWALAFSLYCAPQLFAFERLGEAGHTRSLDLLVHLRSMVAIIGRYLLMAATSWGVSAFQNPAPATSWLDPWWLGSLVVGVLLAACAVASIVRGRPEGGFWLWAGAGYAPVSQLFPFLYPTADRYLYVVLPGLLGVALLSGSTLANRVSGDPVHRATRSRVAAALAMTILAVFAWRSFERAKVFRTNLGLELDSARHFPDGLSAAMLRARRAAQEDDVDGTVTAIRRARELGFDDYAQLDEDPGFASVRHDPRFRTAVAEVAGAWIEIARARGYATQLELRALAKAHAARAEWPEAVSVLERAAATPGPVGSSVRAELAQARRELARTQERTDGTKAP